MLRNRKKTAIVLAMRKIALVLLMLIGFSCFALAEDTQWPTLKNLKNADAANVYDRPYSLTENKVDKTILYQNTGALVGAGVAVMGILYLMPSSFTNWEDNDKSPAQKWWHNVSRGPVWDKDDLYLNYVAHPYVGAIYYMGARSAGANAGYSFLYSFALSTFFWECGIEAFAERPSIQDLVFTPTLGALVGEGFYLAKRSIYDNDNKLLGSEALGKTVVFLMDPMTEVTEWLFRDTPQAERKVSLASQPIVTPHGGVGYGLQMRVNF